MSRRMSKRRLLEVLRDLLESPIASIRRGKLRKEHGLTNYDRDPATGDLTNIKIVIDPRNSPVVTIVIHELLHVYMAQQHEIDRLFSESLEESMVKGLADELESYLHDTKNERLFLSWVRAVEAKLK